MRKKLLFLTFLLISLIANSQKKGIIYTSQSSFVINNATINGHVYKDTNGNGIQNVGESNLSNIDILLNQSDGSFQIVTTDINGDWSALVSHGITTVTLDANDLPPSVGLIQTEGTNPNTVFAVALQTTYAGTDGFFYVGKVMGHLYYDNNGNGIQNNPIEQNIQNVNVIVTDFFGNVYTVVSDVQGNWTATVGVGLASVLVDTNDPDFPSGAIQTEGTNPSGINVILGVNTFSENDGFYRIGTATGHLYFDVNGNGMQDLGENNMPNVTVNIVDSLGISHNITTNSNGVWSLQLPAGTATATINTSSSGFPQGAFQTEGINPNTFIVVTGITTNTGNNGFYNKGVLKGHLYIDLNNNGVQDSSEPNLPNVSVKITDSTMAIQIVVTNSFGDWQVTVPSGVTTSLIDVLDPDFPSGAVQTEGMNPITSNVLSNQVIATSNCGFFLAIDTDGDGIFDYIETSNGTNPNNPCSPTQSIGYAGYESTNVIWQNSDCDGDGILNTIEHSNGTDPYNPCSPLPAASNTNYDASNPLWQSVDCDGDGLTNGQEVNIGTNPFLADTDGDGISDLDEVINTTNPLDSCLPLNTAGFTNYDSTNIIWQNSDCDGDGVSNGNEFLNQTDPYNPCDPTQFPGYTGYDGSNPLWQEADCDGDGAINGDELLNGTDPYDESDNGIIIYNAISPNNDGKNDTFFVKGIQIFTHTSLSVINRWGVEVFNAENYANDFNGFSKGRVTLQQDEKLPAGTYYYVFQFTRPDGIQKQQKGYLYIN